MSIPLPQRRSSRSACAIGVAVALSVVGLVADHALSTAATSLPPPPACLQSEQNPTSSSSYEIPIANYIVDGTLTQTSSTGTTEITDINATTCGLLQFPSLRAAIPEADITYQQATLESDGIPVGTVTITASSPSAATTSYAPAPNGGLVFTLAAGTESVLNIGNTGLAAILDAALAALGLSGLTSLLHQLGIPSGLLGLTSSPAKSAAAAPASSPPAGDSPDVTVPKVTLPSLTLPTVTVPKVTVPKVTVPTITVPSVTIPSGSLPAVIQCGIGLTATFTTDPSGGGKALVGSLATGAQGIAYASGLSAIHMTALTATDPNNTSDETFCPLLNSLLRPSTTPATFSAPLDFYSTLTSFSG